MISAPLTKRIIQSFDGLSGQLQSAAQFVLDHPHDVALKTMRDQARAANVKPATMTRLAQHLGFQGYDEIRELYAAAVRKGELGYAGKAGVQAARQKSKGDDALSRDMAVLIAQQIGTLEGPVFVDRMVAAAKCIASADHVYCLGLRSCHAVAWYMAYILSLIGCRSTLLDGAAAIGFDPIAHAKAKDVLVVNSIKPYARQTIEIAQYAASRKVTIVAITDSEVAPIARLARHVIVVGTDSPSFFHAMSPSFAVAEILNALVAGQRGRTSQDALRKTDERLRTFRVFLKSPHQ
jgi:DNA-binding MurR/RpiR family transcriptional regulator